MEKMKWNALSMRDRAFLIREAVRNGITDIDSIRDTWEHRFDGESNQPTNDRVSNKYIGHFPYVFETLTFPPETREDKEYRNKTFRYSPQYTSQVESGEYILSKMGDFTKNDSLIYTPLLNRLDEYLKNKSHYANDEEALNQRYATWMLTDIVSKKMAPYNENHKFINDKLTHLSDNEIDALLNVQYYGPGASIIKGLKAKPKNLKISDLIKMHKIMKEEYFQEKSDDNPLHQFSGEGDSKINWKAIGSTLYDIGEIVDPTGISSWATPEGDLYQAVKNYKEGTGSIEDIALNTLGALPILGPIGKAIKIGKGGARIAKTISKAAKNAKVIDDFLELIPGIKKATSATQAVTGTATQALGDVLNLSNNARFWANKGIQVLNTANTMSDVVGAIGNTIDRDYTQNSPSVAQEDPNTGINKALLDASRRLEEEENSKHNRKGGWDEKNKRWYPHPSPEGGAHTIGYGIKLNPNTKWAKVVEEQGYLSEDQEKQARLEMLEESERVARTSYDNRFGKGEWDKLDFKPQSLLIDRTYNAGSISQFPNFVKTIHDGDLEGMRGQYKVYMTKGKGKRKKKVELGRNKTISREIDSLEQGFYPIFKEN